MRHHARRQNATRSTTPFSVITSTLTILSIAFAPGCATTPSGTKLAGAYDPKTLANEISQQNYAAETTVARLQKPDEKTPPSNNASILDLASYQVASSQDARVSARIRATVNGVAILDDEVREAVFQAIGALQSIPEPERTRRRKDLYDRELKALIDREIILQDMYQRLKERGHVLDKVKEAANREFEKKVRDLRKVNGITSDDEFKRQLKAQGIALDGIKRQMERSFMAMEYMRNLIVPKLDRIGHQEIVEYYKSHAEEFQLQDRVVWLDIFIDAAKFASRAEAKNQAEQLVSQAKAGADFLSLVRTHDKGDSSYRNGEGFGQRRGEIKPKEAEPHLFEMKEGDIGPIVELSSGYHVIKLVKRERAGQKTLDEKTQTAIKGKLQNDGWEKEYKRILADLKRKAAIEIASDKP